MELNPNPLKFAHMEPNPNPQCSKCRFDHGSGFMGMGWVIRSDEGAFVAAKGVRRMGTYTIEEAETVKN
nr:uncharacterized protein LOC109147742 [Ipomoea batatas]